MIYSLGERKVQLPDEDCFIAHNAIVIGSVVVGKNASIWFNTIIRGDNDWITIGDDCNIQDGAVLHTDERIRLTIGRGVTVGHMAMLHGCSIGDFSLIGIKSVVLNNAKIGPHCIVGANTLIPENKEIPEGYLVLGTPGRIIRPLTKEEIAGLKGSAEHYVKNFKRYKAQLRKQTSPIRELRPETDGVN